MRTMSTHLESRVSGLTRNEQELVQFKVFGGGCQCVVLLSIGQVKKIFYSRLLVTNTGNDRNRGGPIE